MEPTTLSGRATLAAAGDPDRSVATCLRRHSCSAVFLMFHISWNLTWKVWNNFDTAAYLEESASLVASHRQAPAGALASDRIYFVPAGARQSDVTSAPDTLIVSTNLKSDLGNTERSLRDVVHLEDVNALQVPYGRTDLCECSPDFKDLLQALLRRFFHQWGITL